jgi:hypothetical protein
MVKMEDGGNWRMDNGERKREEGRRGKGRGKKQERG